MFLTKDLPIDEKYPDSCVYWIYHEDKHTDPRTQGYVGVSSKGANPRFACHNSAVKRGSQLLIHRAMRKYGSKMKVRTLLEASPEFCLLAEYMLRPLPNMAGTYNLAMGGESSGTTGTTMSDETKQKISAHHLANPRTYSEETRRKLSVAGRSLVVSESTKQHLRSVHTGRKQASWVVEKNSKAQKLRQDGQPWNNAKAIKELWLNAETIVSMLSSGAKTLEILRVVGVPYSKDRLKVVRRMWSQGWNPSVDERYALWLQEHKLKESANAVT